MKQKCIQTLHATAQLLKVFKKVKKSRITFNLDSGKPPSETE